MHIRRLETGPLVTLIATHYEPTKIGGLYAELKLGLVGTGRSDEEARKALEIQAEQGIAELRRVLDGEV